MVTPGAARTQNPDPLRAGARQLLEQALLRGGVAAEPAKALADQLENACLAAARAAGPDPRGPYADAYGSLCRALPEPFGEFLEAPLCAQLADGRVCPAEAATPAVFRAHEARDPRLVGRALIYAQLAKDPRIEEDLRRDWATRAERGCYNAAIARCDESEDSYRRQWDSGMFVNVYSGRVGVVAANLDPGGSVAAECATGGAPPGTSWALDMLASGAWSPDALGGMSAAELCPLAGKAERDLIQYRLEQKVAERISSLFSCPRCHKRHHTYRTVQMRSSDESSTIMCTCKVCGENFEGFA